MLMNPLEFLLSPVGRKRAPQRRPDPARIVDAVDLKAMGGAHVLIVGTGGALTLVQDLARCGLGAVTAIDPDRFGETNICSQDARCSDVGRPKVEVLGERLRDIHPDLKFRGLVRDFLEMGEDEMAALVQDVDLILMMTDNFFAQARGNRVSLKFGKPALFAIIYTGGEAVEVTWNLPGVTPACHRCVTAGRYRFYERGFQDTAGSSGATVFSGHLLNGVLGMLCLAFLHRGAAGSRFGDWMQRLGERNFMQMRFSPDFVLQGACGPNDVFGRHLGTGWPRFAFDTIWLSPDDPPAYERCPDCGSTGDLRDAQAQLQGTMPVFDSGQPMREPSGNSWVERVSRQEAEPTRKPVVEIPEDVLDEIREAIGKRRAETGGMLVGDRKDPFRVTHFHYDAGGSVGASRYDPDYQALNRALKTLYEPRGLDMVGFVHSHPPGVRHPSGDWGGNIGDIGYASATLRTNPDLQVFLMPIVMTVPDSGRFEVLSYVVFRDRPDQAVEAEVRVVPARR